jgi:quercetin dioxygenase-like cupin family protein
MRTRRSAALLALAATTLLAACAQPGELGGPPVAAEPVTVTAPAPEPAPAAGPVLLGSGTIADPVSLETSGPAVFSVRTVVVPPGGTTGWHRHPGTETSVVTAGEVTLIREGDCEPETFTAGEAVFVPDALPHEARNDGTVPAEVVVTYLLAPGAPERFDEPAGCENG